MRNIVIKIYQIDIFTGVKTKKHDIFSNFLNFSAERKFKERILCSYRAGYYIPYYYNIEEAIF